MPVAGYAGQETGKLRDLVETLAADPAVRQGLVRVVAFVNRPVHKDPDATAAELQRLLAEAEVPFFVIEGTVPENLGRNNGPYMSRAAHEGSTPIALIRDALNIAVMKCWLNSSGAVEPVVLQMDVDFEGFAAGSLLALLETFRSRARTQFVQCTSRFDDPELPNQQCAELDLGEKLMWKLPLALKVALNSGDALSALVVNQIVFGSAIQRGIQVPQAERLESIAARGGYGLLRMPEDELDANFRGAFLSRGVQACETLPEVQFIWSNRRAILAMSQHGIPAISQWAVEFKGLDCARDRSFVSAEYARMSARRATAEQLLAVINMSLKRLPLPRRLEGVYGDQCEQTRILLQSLGVDEPLESFVLVPRDKGSDLFFVQLLRLSDASFTELLERGKR